MSYASDYMDLMNRLTVSRSKRLMDVATMTGQAQMQNAQTWGQVPMQIASAVTNAVGQYQDQKKLDLAQQRQASMDAAQQQRQVQQDRQYEAERQQWSLQNTRAEADAKAKQAAEAERVAEAKQKAAEQHLALIGPTVAPLISSATSSYNSYKQNLPALRAVATTVAEARRMDPNTLLSQLPDEPEETTFATIQPFAEMFSKAFQPKTIEQAALGMMPTNDLQGVTAVSNALHPPTAPRPVAVQTRENGRDVTKFVTPTEGASYPAQPHVGQAGSGSGASVATPLPLGVTAEDAYKSMDPKTASVVRQLVEYRIPLPSGMALRSDFWQDALAKAGQVDPTFDASLYNTRLSLRRNFTAGKNGDNIKSLNTAVGHIDSLVKKANALNNWSATPANAVANAVNSTLRGDARVVGFETAANAVAGELATVFKGTSGTDQEITKWRSSLNPNMSPEQFRESTNTMLELLSSRLSALTSQYQNGMGKPKNFRILDAKSRSILSKLGMDVDAIDPVTPSGLDPIVQSVAPNGFWIAGDDGSKVDVGTQEKYDRALQLGAMPWIERTTSTTPQPLGRVYYDANGKPVQR